MKCHTCNDEIPINTLFGYNLTITLKQITTPNGQDELKAYHMIYSPKRYSKTNLATTSF